MLEIEIIEIRRQKTKTNYTGKNVFNYLSLMRNLERPVF